MIWRKCYERKEERNASVCHNTGMLHTNTRKLNHLQVAHSFISTTHGHMHRHMQPHRRRNGGFFLICMAHVDTQIHEHTLLFTFGDCLFWSTSGTNPTCGDDSVLGPDLSHCVRGVRRNARGKNWPCLAPQYARL